MLSRTDPVSLYTLLLRWTRWGLVIRDKASTPYRYHLGSAGRRYLRKLPNWYPCHETVRGHVLETMRPIICWAGKKNGVTNHVHCLAYPFKQASDFFELPISESGEVKIPGTPVWSTNPFNKVHALGLEVGPELINHLLNLHIISRTSGK